MKKSLSVLLLLLFNYSAQAALVASDNTAITVALGQTYSQSFTVSPTEFSNVVLSLDVFGDFGDTQNNEHFNFFIDDILLADLHSTDHAGFTATTDEACCSWNFIGDLAIDNASWSAFAADGTLDISWTTGSEVHLIGSSNYVDWSLNGATASAVPVPAAIWLFGSGLLGLLGMRKNSFKVS